MRVRRRYLLAAIGLFLLLACNGLSAPFGIDPPTAGVTDPTPTTIQATLTETSQALVQTATSTSAHTPEPSPTMPPQRVRFAVIGDFGQGNQAAADVASLVKSWSPDLVITVGDNNYPVGSPATIDQNVGQFYREFIFPYRGAFGEGASEQRFFPTMGNHDWDTGRGAAYLDYFELPGNERYYDFIWEPVHFFALSTDSREPDGVGRSSTQAMWFQERLAGSTAIWKVVYGHHPPYTSGLRGPVDWMRWPFKDWGATVYLAGHDHFYERLEVDGMLYLINGLGGGPIYDVGFPTAGSLVRFNDDYGALLVVAEELQITFQFITRSGEFVDEYQIVKAP